MKCQTLILFMLPHTVKLKNALSEKSGAKEKEKKALWLVLPVSSSWNALVVHL